MYVGVYGGTFGVDLDDLGHGRLFLVVLGVPTDDGVPLSVGEYGGAGVPGGPLGEEDGVG